MTKRKARSKAKIVRPLYLQLVFVTLAFALMVGSCGVYVNNMLTEDMADEAAAALTRTQLRIDSELLEAETLCIVLAAEVRGILIQGGGAQEIQRYVNGISDELQEKTRGFTFGGIHTYIETSGELISSLGWEGQPGYTPTDRPWYIAAQESHGNVVASPMYEGIRSSQYMISFVCRVFDGAGQPLGVVSLNVPLGNIAGLIADTRLTDGGFGFLLNRRYEVAVSGVPEHIGLPIEEASPGFLGAMQGAEKPGIFQFEFKNQQGLKAVFSCINLDNGWYMGVMTPRDEYYRALMVLMLYLCALGTVLMLTLYIILIRIDAAKSKLDKAYAEQSVQMALMEKIREADEQTQIMLDAMPL